MARFEDDPYRAHGYSSREEYLESLAADNGLPREVVEELSEVLGPEEDFDGLVVSVEDYTPILSMQ